MYWYNGQIIGSEMQRGLDIFELTPSGAISQNEIDAAKTIHMDFLNVQDQPKFVWPASFALSRSYTDQLERWKGLTPDKVSAVRAALTAAEGMNGSARRDVLSTLAGVGWRIHERLVGSVACAVARDVAQGSGERVAVVCAEGSMQRNGASRKTGAVSFVRVPYLSVCV